MIQKWAKTSRDCHVPSVERQGPSPFTWVFIKHQQLALACCVPGPVLNIHFFNPYRQLSTKGRVSPFYKQGNQGTGVELRAQVMPLCTELGSEHSQLVAEPQPLTTAPSLVHAVDTQQISAE